MRNAVPGGITLKCRNITSMSTVLGHQLHVAVPEPGADDFLKSPPTAASLWLCDRVATGKGDLTLVLYIDINHWVFFGQEWWSCIRQLLDKQYCVLKMSYFLLWKLFPCLCYFDPPVSLSQKSLSKRACCVGSQPTVMLPGVNHLHIVCEDYFPFPLAVQVWCWMANPVVFYSLTVSEFLPRKRVKMINDFGKF